MGYDYKFDRLELRFEQLSTHLAKLDRAAIPHVTRYFEAVAAMLRRKRQELDGQARQQRAMTRRLAALPAYPDSPSGRRMRREAEMKARAIEIMRLASRGWPNERIGRKVGITSGQVSRIIRRQLKLTRSPSP